MNSQEQPLRLQAENVDSLVGQKEDKPKRHGALLPDSIRASFCGPSNCGKTNVLLSLLIHPNGLKFDYIYIYIFKITESTKVQVFGGTDRTDRRHQIFCIQ